MPVTLKQRVEAYTGLLSDTDLLNQWLKDGVRLIIDLMPEDKLEEIAKDSDLADQNTGRLLQGCKFLRAVSKTGYPALKGNPSMKTAYLDKNSLHQATENNPISINLKGSIYVLPGGGTVYCVDYPQVDSSLDTIEDFISEYEAGVVLYASIKGMLKTLQASFNGLTTFTLDDIIMPIAPADPAFTFTNAELSNFTPATVGNLGTAPEYISPVSTEDFSEVYALGQSEEDTELAQAQLQKINLKLNKFQADIQNAVQLFNQKNVAYQSSVQKAIDEARMSQETLLTKASKETDLNLQNEMKQLEKQISEYRSKVEKYQTELQAYQSRVGSRVQLYGVQIQQVSIKFQSIAGTLTSLRNEFNEFLQVNFGAGQPANKGN